MEQLASISEMCDRTVYEAGANGLSAVLHEYLLVSDPRRLSVDVHFPDGTSVMASPLSAREANCRDRDFGLYMDPSWAPTWDAELINWPDFGLPADQKTAAGQIMAAFERAKNRERVEIGCIGGFGRTGTVLACMAILAGVPADKAVDWVRANYNPRAIETSEQAEWVLWFGQFIRESQE